VASEPVGPTGGTRVPAPLRRFRTLPSSVAFSPAGRFVVPARLGIGRAGHVALTFDDGPDPFGTPAVMRALELLGWSATFFVVADQVDRAPGLLRELVAAGHEIGVHAGSHVNQRNLTAAEVRDDIRRAYDTVAEVVCVKPHWYRPPHGALSSAAVRTAKRLGLRPVLWTAWGRDWRTAATPQSICAEISSGRLDGGTILLHDSDCASDPGSWHATVGALPMLAGLLQARGLTVGPLGEHLGARAARRAAVAA
jgi:peptidoglycan/xylan/chitin deacetylase (PgdA/CDA1 family)